MYLFDEKGPDKRQIFLTGSARHGLYPQFDISDAQFKFVYTNPYLSFLIFKVIIRNNEKVIS